MILESITIKNFRNHSYKTFDFSPSLNAFIGENSVGKTNIVEAIYYLSLARSFKTKEINNLIKEGKEISEIKAVVRERDIKREINIILTKQGRSVVINRKLINKLSTLSKIVNVLIFEPKDVNLFKGSPKGRRDFLDINLSKKNEPYLKYISCYEKILKERNDLLKQTSIDKDLLDTQTEMLIKYSSPIAAYRQSYIKDINNILKKITRALTGVYKELEISYKPFIPFDDQFETNSKNAFKSAIESDLRKKVTTIGIHHDDFIVSLNGRNIAEFGSQGENRLAALALKIAPYFLIEDKDKKPIIVLDDALSELDEENQKRLLEFVGKLGQVFLTTTTLSNNKIKTFQIKKGENT